MGAHRQLPTRATANSVRRIARGRALHLVATAAAVWLFGCHHHIPPDLPQSVVSPTGPTSQETTFLVAADTHLGAEGLLERNRRQIRAMHDLPGTPWPKEVGGSVGQPIGVLIAGDLTNWGAGSEWEQFLAFYGSGGLLRYPVYECTGNHDRYAPFAAAVFEGVRARYGGLLYGVALGPVRAISLDLYPDADAQHWLTRQLARIGKDVPIVLFFHYPLAGYFADWWSEDDKQSLARILRGYSIEGIFHGHAHNSLHYRWQGYDVYNVGSPRHGWKSFAVVHVAHGTFTVAAWDWDDGVWAWSHQKPMEASATATDGKVGAFEAQQRMQVGGDRLSPPSYFRETGSKWR